ncbi:MAG: hypothetical protein LBD09_05180 [Treponema sp.]|jgi:hypothetical protein|nr:hypothetical protein [Treponema sp.]
MSAPSRFDAARFPLILVLILAAAVLGIAVFCKTQLEIVDDVRRKGASRLAQANSYLALERWLQAAGRAVRGHSAGTVDTILRGPERIIFVEDSRFNWTGQNGTAAELLIPWIREGGRLVVSLDAYANRSLELFMEALGIESMDPFDDDFDNVNEENEPGGGDRAAETGREPETPERQTAPRRPVLDNQKRFRIREQKSVVDKIRIMEGWIPGSIALVWLELDRGWVVFTGEAVFLHNDWLSMPENAALAGELFLDKPNAAAETAKSAESAETAGSSAGGILLIRGLTGDRRILGNLADRGNPAALVTALALVIIAGFWMALPGFGRFRPPPEKPGKPLRERFLAEGRFLKKYRALGKYIEIYRRELEQRRAADPFAEPAVPGADTDQPLGFREFVRAQRILLEQLDRLDQHNRLNQHDHDS